MNIFLLDAYEDRFKVSVFIALKNEPRAVRDTECFRQLSADIFSQTYLELVSTHDTRCFTQLYICNQVVFFTEDPTHTSTTHIVLPFYVLAIMFATSILDLTFFPHFENVAKTSKTISYCSHDIV